MGLGHNPTLPEQQLEPVHGVSRGTLLPALSSFVSKKEAEEPVQQHLTARLRGQGGS